MRRGRSTTDDSGSAAVLATVLVGALVTVTTLVAVVGDLGALAGASAVQRGEDACVAAGSVTARNGAVLTDCSVVGQIVTVRARRVTDEVLGLEFTLTATARGGPASAVAAA